MKNKKRKNNKYLFAGIIILIVVVAGILIMYLNNSGETNDENGLGSSSIIGTMLGSTSISTRNLVGKWTGVSESVWDENFDINFTLIFNKDGTYSLNEVGMITKGKYKIFGTKILFYQTDAELNAYKAGSGSFEYAIASFQNGNLILDYPMYPKTDTYEKA